MNREGRVQKDGFFKSPQVRAAGIALVLFGVGSIGFERQADFLKTATPGMPMPFHPSTYFIGWLVAAVVAYAVVRLLWQKAPEGLPLIGAGLLFAAGLNGHLFINSTNHLRVYEAMSKAAPFYSALQRGEIPTDAAIKAAKIGDLEPLLLVQVGFRRELERNLSIYDNALAALAPQTMLTSERLATTKARAETRARMDEMDAKLETFETQVDALLDRTEKKAAAAMAATPKLYGMRVEYFSSIVSRMRDYYFNLATAHRKMQDQTRQMLALLDANAARVHLEAGPQKRLLFEDTQLMTKVQQQVREISTQLSRMDAMNYKFTEDMKKHSNPMASLLKDLKVK